MRRVDPERHARQRARILDAAAVEFAAHGVDGTSTAAICRRAGIGSGTLFHYFATKSDIVYALFADDLPGNEAARQRALAEPSADAGLDLLLTYLLRDLGDPLVPGLVAAVTVHANKDAAFAELLAHDDTATRLVITTLVERIGENSRLVFPVDHAARWIQHLVDAAFSAVGEEGVDPNVQTSELRQLIGWILGR